MAFLITAAKIATVEGALFSFTGIFMLVMLPAALVLLSLIALGCHRPEVRSSLRGLLERLCVAGLLGCAVVSSVQTLVLGGPPAVSSIVVAVSGGCAVIIGAQLWGWQVLLARRVSGPRTLVLGSGQRAGTIWRLVNGYSLDVELVGFLGRPGYDGEALPEIAARLVEAQGCLASYALSRRISEIVVACDDGSALPIDELIACRLRGITVTDSGAFIERETRRIDLQHVDPSWLIFNRGFGQSLTRAAVKRLEDIAVGAGLLLLFAPLAAIIAVLIKLDSPGPVLYRQKRVGLNGHTFIILKFRSMRSDAESDGCAKWAQTGDPRITSFGRFLRLTRLDELPQIVNVLLGEMSLVGPRPERPEFTAQLAQDIPFYNERHNVKPGLTGWAQINYSYGASLEAAREKLKYDLYYMKNWSLFLDFVILLETVRILLFREGAR